MKTTFLFLMITLGFSVMSFAQNTYVPDDNFEQALIDLGYDTPPLDNYVPTANINTITALNVSSKNISDLTGIEGFVALTALQCNENQLTSLDLSNNTALGLLYCRRNQLTSLNVLNNSALRFLYCDWNNISSLNLSNNILLEVLICDKNEVTSLDFSNNISLRELDCTWNQLTSLNVSNNILLNRLSCYVNQITSLDLSNNPSLSVLWCGGNQLNSLDVSNNSILSSLFCDNNNFSVLNLSQNANLTQLSCSNLDYLDVSNNILLTLLYCGGGNLTNIDLSNNIHLKTLACSRNLIANIDVSNNPALLGIDVSENLLTNIDVSNNPALKSIMCYSNQLSSLDVSMNPELSSLFISDNQITNIDLSQNIDLETFWADYNQLTALDVSNNPSIISLKCNNNQLSNLNVKNGNNVNFTYFEATLNPNLTCIQVDNAAWSYANWPSKPPSAIYSENCSSLPIAVTSPNGDEIWATGSIHNITWSEGSGTNTKIELWNSATNLKVSDIASNIVGQSYSWTIGAIAIGSTYKIKVIDNGDGSTDLSNANFRITQPIAVTSPNGGEIWERGSVHNITWSEGSGTNTNIELWDSATNLKVSDIASGIVGQSWSWTIPEAFLVGSNYKIKVIDNGDGSIDLSNANFIITRIIEVLTPSLPGIVWAPGSSHNITWIGGSDVIIELLDFSSSAGPTIYPITSGAASPYTWSISTTIPVGNLFRIRIKDAAVPSFFDQSDYYFTIDQPISLTVNSPNGGEIWATGTNHTISWSGGFGVNTKIELWNSATNLKVSDIANNIVGQSYSWTIGAIASGSTYRIKVIDNVDGSTDLSNANFRITQPIAVISPNGGEILEIGTVHDITWSGGSGTDTKIELWRSGVYLHDIATGIFGQSYSWTIGLGPADPAYRIKVIDNGDLSSDLSDGMFWIIPPLEVTSPNGGEIWEVGSVHDITWSVGSGILTKIELWNSATNLKVSDIANDITGQSYSWTIGAIATGSTYKIKVICNNSNDLSDANFTITDQTSSLAVTAPNGGEIWATGTNRTISWSGGSGTNTKIELWNSATNLKVTDIANGIAGQSYSWTIGSIAVGSTYKIKVIDNVSGSSGLSSANFRITQAVVVVQPNSFGTSWDAGTSHDIIWTGGTGNATIELLDYSGAPTVYPVTTGAISPYSWTIAMDIPSGTQYKIRITDAGDLTSDVSNSNFQITEYIRITQPNLPGIQWNIGSSHAITWNDNILGPVNIYLFDINTGTTTMIVPNAIGNNNSYQWTIPANTPIGNNYKIKISSVSNPALYDLSDNSFSIVAANNNFFVNVIQPSASGLIWNSGENYLISWTDNLSQPVKIDLINDASNITTPIAASVPGSTYSWHISEATPNGTQYKIRISSVTGNGTQDLSDNYFEITDTPASTNIVIMQPTNSGITWLRGSSYLISWTDNVPDNNVSIILCNAAGNNIATLKSNAPGSTWVWTVPASIYPPGAYKIKIAYKNASGISANPFTISDSPEGAYINILQPNLHGITWLRGSTYLISWDDNIPGTVDIFYERTSNPTEVPIATNVSGSTFAWTIPQITPASDYWITIRSHADASKFGMSENPFAISDYLPGGSIDINQPNGGEIWTKGNSYLISWDDNFTENVKIELVNYATSTTIILAASLPGSTWAWTIPNTSSYPAGVLYKMKISSTQNPAVFAESDNYFTITDQVLTAVVYPNPANRDFNLQFSEEISGNYTLSFSNRFNMVVMSRNINVQDVKEINVSTFGLNDGVYVLTIASENVLITKKVIIQNY